MTRRGEWTETLNDSTSPREHREREGLPGAHTETCVSVVERNDSPFDCKRGGEELGKRGDRTPSK